MRKRMNQQFFLFGLITCLIVILIGNTTSAARKGELDIDRLAGAVERQNGSIVEWSLHTRELVDLSSGKRTKEKLQNQLSGWVYDTTGEVVTATFNHGDLHEKIKWIKKDRSVFYVSYEIKGTEWNEKIADQAERLLEKRMKQLYGHKTFVFSCIKGTFNVLMKSWNKLSSMTFYILFWLQK